MTRLKKFIVIFIFILVVYSGYLYFKLFDSSNGLDEVSILTNCSSKEYKTSDRFDKFGFVPSSLACFLRNHFVGEIVKPGDGLIHKLEMYSGFSKACYFDYFIDKKEQLFCFYVFRDILWWFKEKSNINEDDYDLNSKIVWLDKEIKYNIDNPWEKLFPELNNITEERLKGAIRWFGTMSNEDGWNLTENEQLKLLGGIEKQEFLDLLTAAKSKTHLQLSKNLEYRLILLKGIYDVLENKKSVREDATGKDWFITPNQDDIFMAKSPKDFIIYTGMIGTIFVVRGYLTINN